MNFTVCESSIRNCKTSVCVRISCICLTWAVSGWRTAFNIIIRVNPYWSKSFQNSIYYYFVDINLDTQFKRSFRRDGNFELCYAVIAQVSIRHKSKITIFTSNSLIWHFGLCHNSESLRESNKSDFMIEIYLVGTQFRGRHEPYNKLRIDEKMIFLWNVFRRQQI